jgi:serine/threonine protein kinase
MDDKISTEGSNADASNPMPERTTKLGHTGSTASQSSDEGGHPFPGGNDISGTTLGGYRLVRKLAEGGMGVVYEAIQLKLDRRVALKVLTDQLSGRPEFLKRFEREAKAAAALNHPNVVHVHDFGEAAGRHYIVMEFVEGEDLSDYTYRIGKLPVDEALNVVESAALALKAACDKSIIHRDIKPSNLMLTIDGRVKVSDLGLAKILTENTEVTATGVGIGSPYFIAPEQADDASSVDHRVDIYSLGITLLFLLTGKRPYEGNTPFSIVLAHVNKPLPSGADLGTNLPTEVEDLIRRMAAKDRNDRYQDYDSLLADVRRVREGFAPTPAPIRFKSAWRSPKILVAGAAAAVVVGILAFILFRPGQKASVQETQSLAQESTQLPQPDMTEMAEFSGEPRDPNYEQQGGRRPPPQGGGLRQRGPGGPGSRGGGGEVPLPMGPPPVRNHSPLQDGPIETMLAEADALAAQPEPDYVTVIEAYRQVLQKAAGTPRAAARLNGIIQEWEIRHQTAGKKAVSDYTQKMKETLASGSPAEAVAVWNDFPGELRSWEVDQAIIQALNATLPDWQNHIAAR